MVEVDQVASLLAEVLTELGHDPRRAVAHSMNKSLVMQARLQDGFPPHPRGDVRRAHGGAINPRGLLHAPGHTQTGLPPQQSFTLACIRPAAGLHHRHHAAIHFRDEPPGQKARGVGGSVRPSSGHGPKSVCVPRCRGPQSGNAPSPVRRPGQKRLPHRSRPTPVAAGASIRAAALRRTGKRAEAPLRVAPTAATVRPPPPGRRW